MTDLQLATFLLDDRLYGIEVALVQEILRGQPCTRVPRAAPMVAGLLSLRGELVTAIDLRRCLGVTVEGRPAESMNVVVRHHNELLSLLVDRIGDVVVVDDTAMAAPPETLVGRARTLVRGTYDLRGAVVHVLDLDTALAA